MLKSLIRNRCLHDMVSIPYWVAIFVAAMLSAQVTGNAQETITNINQILKLAPDQAAQGIRVHVKAVVTLSERRTELLFVQDDTAGIFVYYQGPELPLRPGQKVEVSGVTGPGLFSPIIWQADITAGKMGRMPAPRLVTPRSLAAGGDDSQWVEMKGVVRNYKEEWGHQLLEIVSNEERVQIRVLNLAATNAASLVGAKVRIQGVVGTRYNNKRQVTGFHIYVPNSDFITVLQPAPANVFDQPPRRARSLLSYSFADRDADKQAVRLQGTVLMQWPGKLIFIQDQSGGIQIQTTQTNLLDIGDLVDVVGFPKRGGYGPLLQDATYHPIRSGKAPMPTTQTPAAISKGEGDTELVTVTGMLIKRDTFDQNSTTLLLQDGTQFFQAILPLPPGDDPLKDLLLGSRLRLTGVAEVLVDENGNPHSFRLWLRSPSDIGVLEKPSGWFFQRVMAGVGLGVFGVLTGLIWVCMLRRRVAEQTKLIRRREAALEERYRTLFENANDIIYSHDLEGRITAINRAGEQILGYSQEEFIGMNVRQLVIPKHWPLIKDQLARKLAGNPPVDYEVQVVTKDGDIVTLEIRAHICYEDGKPVGVEGFARDITERKEAEEALRESQAELREVIATREQIGRDLHDGIIQSLYAIGLTLEGCRVKVRENPAEAAEQISKISTDLNQVLRDVRNFILGLEPEVLKHNGIETALRALVLAMSKTHGPRFVLNIDPLAAAKLDSSLSAHMVLIAREAMSNSLRHANATQTSIGLSRNNGHVRFEVRDDGDGFNPAELGARGHGLRNMAFRAQELGAQFEIDSQPGKGTVITLDIPARSNHESN